MWWNCLYIVCIHVYLLAILAIRITGEGGSFYAMQLVSFFLHRGERCCLAPGDIFNVLSMGRGSFV